MQKFVTKGSEGGSTGIHGLLKVGGGGSKCDFLFAVCLFVQMQTSKHVDGVLRPF